MIQNLDSNKPHDHDNISICMLKICVNSIYKPLEMIFRQALLTGGLPSDWKVSIHKKGDKQNTEKIFSVKFFERLIFNETFEFFISNNLISLNQLGSKPGDSCIKQLPTIFINHLMLD